MRHDERLGYRHISTEISGLGVRQPELDPGSCIGITVTTEETRELATQIVTSRLNEYVRYIGILVDGLGSERGSWFHYNLLLHNMG